MLEAAVFGALAGMMMVFPGAAAEAAGQAVSIWAQAVAPVLGPFMACMLMVSSRINGGIMMRTAMGWLCGSPGGARLMREAGLRGRRAMRAAAMTGTMSPMFFVGTVGAWLDNRRLGWVILACHLAGALGIGLCILHPEAPDSPPAAPMPLGTALRESALALLTVALCMMLGCVAARMTVCAFPFLPPVGQAILQCCLEVTTGVKAILSLNVSFAAPVICAVCSFGGLSLLLQNAVFWQDSGITFAQLALLRLFHALLSGALCAVIWILFFSHPH